MAFDFKNYPPIQPALSCTADPTMPELLASSKLKESVCFQSLVLFGGKFQMQLMLSQINVYFFYQKQHYALPVSSIVNLQKSEDNYLLTFNGTRNVLSIHFYQDQPRFPQLLTQQIYNRSFACILPLEHQEQQDCNRIQYLINTQSSSFDNLMSSAEKLLSLVSKLTDICRREAVDTDVLKSIVQADRDRCLASVQLGDVKLLFKGLQEAKKREGGNEGYLIFLLDQAYGSYCNQLMRKDYFANFSDFKKDCLASGFQIAEYNGTRYVGKCLQAEQVFYRRMDTLAYARSGDGRFKSIQRYELWDYEVDLAEEYVKKGEYLVYDGFECRRYYKNIAFQRNALEATI